ncbi:hypothetical protein K9K77_00645 [Candidatus Babeliales bacterium]|nr:hypothetical protein [Candidatus Babeliales bacterium]
MLKKILILSLIFNTSYILPTYSSSDPIGYDVAGIFAVAGTMCAWVAYKNIKQGYKALKEFNRHLKILNEMGITVYKVSKSEVEISFGQIIFVTKEHYKMDIPSHFSEQQEKKVKEHWDLFLINDKEKNKLFGLPATVGVMGSLVLIPSAVAAFCETFQNKWFVEC